MTSHAPPGDTTSAVDSSMPMPTKFGALQHHADEAVVTAATQEVLIHRHVRRQQAESRDEHDVLAIDRHPAVARVTRRTSAAGRRSSPLIIGSDITGRAGRRTADDRAVPEARANRIQHGRSEDRGRQAVLIAAREPDPRRLAEQPRHGVRPGVLSREVERHGLRRPSFRKSSRLLRAGLGAGFAGHRQHDDARLPRPAGEVDESAVDDIRNRPATDDDEVTDSGAVRLGAGDWTGIGRRRGSHADTSTVSERDQQRFCRRNMRTGRPGTADQRAGCRVG